MTDSKWVEKGEMLFWLWIVHMEAAIFSLAPVSVSTFESNLCWSIECHVWKSSTRLCSKTDGHILSISQFLYWSFKQGRLGTPKKAVNALPERNLWAQKGDSSRDIAAPAFAHSLKGVWAIMDYFDRGRQKTSCENTNMVHTSISFLHDSILDLEFMNVYMHCCPSRNHMLDRHVLSAFKQIFTTDISPIWTSSKNACTNACNKQTCCLLIVSERNLLAVSLQISCRRICSISAVTVCMVNIVAFASRLTQRKRPLCVSAKEGGVSDLHPIAISHRLSAPPVRRT